MYLTRFTYDGWCQGPEDVTLTVLVKNVQSFEEAQKKIEKMYIGARDFANLTIE